MTPPTIDVAMVQARLRTMRELLDDLDAGAPVEAALSRDDRMRRHAVERILTQLVELAVSINGHLAVASFGRGAATYRESFELAARAGAVPDDLAARLQPSVGLRDVLVHEYAEVDLALLDRGLDLARQGYRDYVRAVATTLPG